MAETEKILIVHDTYYPEVNEDFKGWLTEFYNNITSAANRIPGMSKEFVLSSELVEYPEDTPEINAKEYDFYIILIHDEVSRTQNLKFQFDQLLTYLKLTGKRLGLLLNFNQVIGNFSSKSPGVHFYCTANCTGNTSQSF